MRWSGVFTIRKGGFESRATGGQVGPRLLILPSSRNELAGMTSSPQLGLIIPAQLGSHRRIRA